MMMYTLMRSWNISFIIRWNVAGAFVIPKNMTVSSYSPCSVMKANFSSSPSLMRTLLYPRLNVMKMRLSDIPFPFSFQNRQSFDTHDHSRLARQDEYNYNHDHYTRTYLLEVDRITTRRPS